MKNICVIILTILCLQSKAQVPDSVMKFLLKRHDYATTLENRNMNAYIKINSLEEQLRESRLRITTYQADSAQHVIDINNVEAESKTWKDQRDEEAKAYEKDIRKLRWKITFTIITGVLIEIATIILLL